MGDFSQLEETFFRAGEQLSEVPVYVEPATERSWFHRFFVRENWGPIELESDPAYYASYELAYDSDFATDELAA